MKLSLNRLGLSSLSSAFLDTSKVTFSEKFEFDKEPGQLLIQSWKLFIQALKGNSYKKFIWSNDLGQSITVQNSTDSSDEVQQIATALHLEEYLQIDIDGISWYVINDGGACGFVFSNSGVGCDCDYGGGIYAIKPFATNGNWGSTNGTGCESQTQTITITFQEYL